MYNRNIVSVIVQRFDRRPRRSRTVPVVHERHLPAIKPLTARSMILSVLLGYHPPELPVSALVRVGGLFDVAERTTRVALSRMVAEGDLLTDNGVYRLTDRLVRRQVRQEESASPRAVPWCGDWEMAVVTSPARPQAERVALRKNMVDLRLAELREGVWVRPANLVREVDGVITEQCTFFECRYQDSADLVCRRWDLEDWAGAARQLHEEMAAPTGLREDFMVIAEAIRHLRLDPYLPPELLPATWPGQDLRERYIGFRDEFAQRLRDYSTSPVAST